jgi:phage-related protein
MGGRESFAWALVAGLLVAFLVYGLIDQRLNWIQFGDGYRQTQAQVVDVLKGLNDRVTKLEQEQKAADVK